MTWRDYLSDYHNDRPAITERLLALASASPYLWMAQALRDTADPVLDLACGSAPTRPLMPGRSWIGLDSSPAELGSAAHAGRRPLVQADAAALPIATGSVGSVCAAMCLQVLTPLPVVLNEISRVLRPGGTLVALVPARPSRRLAGLIGWGRVMATLRVGRLEFPNPQAMDGLAATLREHGFLIQHSQRREFLLSITSTEDVQLLIDGLYLPDVSRARIHAAKQKLQPWAATGQLLPIALRTVVAQPAD